MSTPKSLIFLFFFLSFLGYSQEQSLNFTSYEVAKNKVIFSCENGSKLSLKFLDAENIKFWFSPDGSFKRNNPSFAVVNENFDPSYQIDVNESTSGYEIFTGALRVMVQKKPLKVQIFDKYQRLVMGDQAEAYVVNNSEVETRKVLRDEEQFFGLGEKTGPLNRRGHSYTMWNSDKPCYSDREDPLYKSIPFFLSTYNYGIFFDNTYKTQFDFGDRHEDYFSFSAPDGPFVYYFIYGNDFKEIIASYIKLTGKPIMPPAWALGWSQSRGMLTNEKLTREIANEYRQRNIPCDIIYQDIGWVEGLQNFEWRKDRYQNPKKMLSDLAENGFKVIVSQDPVISQATKAQWQEADENGYLVTDDRTGKSYDMPWPWGGNAGVVDFTNPEVADWWGDLQQKPLDDGVKGFWTDMGEPAWSNEESTDRLHMKHHLGMHSEIHNVYGLTWDKVVTEQFEKHNPNQRIFQMTRAAFAGMQRYTFGWSGDSGNGRDVTDGWDNLANQIPVGLSAGMGLIPFWTSDISGYCGDITDYNAFAELYIRWLEFGIFNPLSRAHHEGNNAVEPWLFGKEAERIAKKSIEFKYQLHPYIYTYAREAYDTGIPIMRALVLEYPQDENIYTANEEFLFGEKMLVAPIVEEGARKRKIYLPEGDWIDYNNPSVNYKGEQEIEYAAPLDVIPILVKKGSILPKMPVMDYIGQMENTPMIFEIFPSEKASSFSLYEDDGVTNDYKKDEFARTDIEVISEEDELQISIEKPEISGGFEFSEKRNFWLEVHLSEKPSSVLNSKKLKRSKKEKLQQNWNTKFDKSGYYFDKNEKLLYILVPDTKEELHFTVKK